MTNDEIMTKHEYTRRGAREIIRLSIFGFPLTFDIRISSFSSRSTHLGNFRQTQHPAENFLPSRVFDLIDRDRVRDIEPAGFCPAQRFQVGAAAEGLADVMYVGANIEAFAAQDAEVDFGQRDAINRVAIDVHQARFALYDFSLARQLVKRHA